MEWARIRLIRFLLDSEIGHHPLWRSVIGCKLRHSSVGPVQQPMRNGFGQERVLGASVLEDWVHLVDSFFGAIDSKSNEYFFLIEKRT